MRHLTVRRALTGLGLAMLVFMLAPDGRAQTEPVQALVPTDLGDTADIVSRMETLGWTVTTGPFLELIAEPGDGSNPLDAYDVIWLVASTTDETFRHIVYGNAWLARFANEGGVVVIADVGANELLPGVAPGGTNLEALPEGGAGTVTISAPDHALITGVGIGGVALTEADLDPSGSGGLGYLTELPDGAIVIAANGSGPVVLEHAIGSGTIILCALASPSSDCSDNIVRYADSLVP